MSPRTAAAQETAPRTGTGVIVGTVVSGDTGEPVASATVELLNAADSAVIRRIATNDEGQIRIASVAEGEYLLRFTSIGYGSVFTQSFELAEAEVRNLGTLRLPVAALALEAIEVSAERSAVTFEADRTSYAVGVMPGTQGTTVTETLQQIPELEVDIDGGITLRGNRPSIYINGRPSPLTGEALAVFLEQFPADYLAKIEVLDNPSARFGAEGSGGIVNLVMKEDVELGMSGSAFLNGGTRGQYGAGARGTMQRGDWTYSGGTFLRLSDVDRTNFDLRQNLFVDPAFLRQDSRTEQSGLSGNFDLDVRYEPTERSRIYVDGRISRSGRESSGLSTTTHLDEAERELLVYERASDSDSRNLSGNLSLGYDYQWEPRRHELEIEMRVQQGNQRGDSRQEITAESGIDQDAQIPAELTVEDEGEDEREASLNIDYTRPLGENGRMEIGVETELSDTENDRLYTQSFENGDVATDRGFEQRELAGSAYMTLQRQLGELGVQLGMRAEHVTLDFAVPTGEEFRREYTNFFPSANVSYRLDNSKQLRLSYSRRIGRPGANVLNPIDRSTDPLQRIIGNPDVEPQFSHSVTMNASWSGSAGNLRLSPYYQTSTNEWVQITTVDDEGVSTRTYQNLASQESYGFTAAYSLRPRNGYGGSFSITGRRTVRDASNLAERYSGTSFRWSSRMNVQARVTGSLSADGNFSYSPPVDMPQGRSDARYTGDFGLRYRFLENRASLRLSLRDPFGLREQSSRLQDLTYIQIGRSRESTKSLDVSLSYSFGGGGWRRGGGGRGPR